MKAMPFQGGLFYKMFIGDVVADIEIADDKRGVVQDLGLESAVILTWFTDKRAGDEDILLDSSEDKRGWLGNDILKNMFPEKNLEFGSKLWLIMERGKINNALIVDIQNELKSSLSWMIDFNLASEIDVTVVREGMEELSFQCFIFRPGKDAINFRYHFNWIEQTIKKVA